MVFLFIAILVNTGLIILLLNANFESLYWWEQLTDKVPYVGDYIFNGEFKDTNRDWYLKVGLPVITIVIFNLISLLAQAMIEAPLAACKRCCCIKNNML